MIIHDSSHQLILFFLRNETSSVCPPAPLLKNIHESELERLAIANKCFPCLFHFIACDQCKKCISPKFFQKIKRAFIQTLSMASLSEKQKKSILSQFEKKKIPYCFLKDFSPYSKVTHHARYFWSSDIDILIHEKHLLRAEKILAGLRYQKMRTHLYEVAFTQANHLEVDLHTLPCDYDINFHLLSYENLAHLTDMLLAGAQKGKPLQKEVFLFFLITHFWINDCLKRIRTLYDIAVFVEKYQSDIDWSEFIQIAQKMNFLQQSLFILHMCSQHFRTPLPQRIAPIKKNIIFRLLLTYHDARRIMSFPKTKEWWSPNQKLSSQMLKECLLTSRLLQTKIPVFLLYKPKIFAFLIRILLKQSFGTFANKNVQWERGTL